MLKKHNINFLYNMKMSEKTLKLGNIIVHKKEFHASKHAIALNFVDTYKTAVSDKFKNNDKGFKHFIGYRADNIIRPFMYCFTSNELIHNIF